MAITSHPAANYQFCFRRVVKFIGAADPNSPEGDAVMAPSPYTPQMIKSQICQSDVEIAALMCSVEGDPYRNKFFTETPDAQASGTRIIGFIGVHGGVEVRRNSDDPWKPGSLAQSLPHLQRLRDKRRINPNLLLRSSNYVYWIDNGKLELVGAAEGRVYVPTIPIPDDTANTPVLSTPRARQNAVIAHSIMTLNPVGADTGHRTNWANIFGTYVQMIISGNPSLPDPEQMERVGS